MNVGSLISDSFAFSKSSLNIYWFLVHVLLKPSLENFEHSFASMIFPSGSAGKESSCSGGDLGSVSGLGRSPGEGKGYPLQYSGLESSIFCEFSGVADSQTGLNDFHYLLTMFTMITPKMLRTLSIYVMLHFPVTSVQFQ